MSARLEPVSFAALDGWAEDNHLAALDAFRRSAVRLAEAVPPVKAMNVSPPCRAAAALLAGGPSPDRHEARAFFERWFAPVRVVPDRGAGFVTGYYEPEVDGTRTADAAFSVPLHALPPDLVELGPHDARDGLPSGLTWARRTAGGFAEHPDRMAIAAGALAGSGLELVYLRSAAEAFFVHVQGSARVRLPGGDVVRLTFAGKSGHPYTGIGRLLVERLGIPPEAMTADRLRGWLDEHPDEGARLMAENRSYIFFRETSVDDPALGPVAAAGVPLTPGRSLAVDRALHTFHTPVFVAAQLPPRPDARAEPFRRLLIAQDTGSAILGPARGDIFFGSGETAFHAAAPIRHPADITLLVEREG